MKIIFIFSILAGICNAIMDTIEFHWYCGLFKWILKRNPKIYWWLHGDPLRKLPFYAWFLQDGWHFFKTWMLIFVSLAIWAAPDGRAAGYFIAGWAIGFNLVFEGLKRWR